MAAELTNLKDLSPVQVQVNAIARSRYPRRSEMKTEHGQQCALQETNFATLFH